MVNLVLCLASALLALVGAEVVLRVRGDGASAPQVVFSAPDPELGWDTRPGSAGTYRGDGCAGAVRHDASGIRLNAPTSTFREGYRNVFFLGASTSAALEVDDDETPAAVLERGLRRRGLRVNVLNLGVRGFGTDQSVRKALRHAPRLHPTDVVYLFNDNDFFDMNSFKLPGSGLARATLPEAPGPRKGRDPGPGPELAGRPEDFAVRLLDPSGAPYLFSGRVAAASSPAEAGAGVSGWLRGHSHLFRLVAASRPGAAPRARRVQTWMERQAEPSEVRDDARYDALDVLASAFAAMADGGLWRRTHPEYFEGQLSAEMGRLREIPGLRRIHVFGGVSRTTQRLLAQGRASDNAALFERLVAARVIGSYRDLNRSFAASHQRLEDFECPSGGHFDAAGNRWVGEAILATLDLEDPVPAAAAP